MTGDNREAMCFGKVTPSTVSRMECRRGRLRQSNQACVQTAQHLHNIESECLLKFSTLSALLGSPYSWLWLIVRARRTSEKLVSELNLGPGVFGLGGKVIYLKAK